MDQNQLEDLATEALEIYESGITIYLRPGDRRKLFVAVVAANVVSYAAFTGIKTLVTKGLEKANIPDRSRSTKSEE
jgi:hypothetical protein